MITSVEWASLVIGSAVLGLFLLLYRIADGWSRGRPPAWEAWALFWLALGVRVGVVVVVDLWLRGRTGTPFLFGTLGDDFRYHETAADMARAWSVGGFQFPAVLYTQGFETTLALVYWITAPEVWIGKLFNVTVGALIAPLVYRLAFELEGRRCAWKAGVLTALFPPLVFWSGVLYKDTLLAAALVGVILAGVRFLSRAGLALGPVVTGLGALLVVGALRLQSVVVAGVAVSASAIVNPVTGGRNRWLRNLTRIFLPVGAALAGAYVFRSQLFAIAGPGVQRYLGLDRIDVFYATRGMALRTTGGAVESSFLSFPTQLVASVFLPLPLVVDTGSTWIATEQAMLAGNIIWLWLLYHALHGTVKADAGDWRNWLPVAVVIVGTVVGIAVRGYGLIYRHKVQMYPFVIALAALSLVRTEEGVWKDRRVPKLLWAWGLAGAIVLYNVLRLRLATG